MFVIHSKHCSQKQIVLFVFALILRYVYTSFNKLTKASMKKLSLILILSAFVCLGTGVAAASHVDCDVGSPTTLVKKNTEGLNANTINKGQVMLVSHQEHFATVVSINVIKTDASFYDNQHYLCGVETRDCYSLREESINYNYNKKATKLHIFNCTIKQCLSRLLRPQNKI